MPGASCPDQICVQTGWLASRMPGRLAVEFAEAENFIDAVAR